MNILKPEYHRHPVNELTYTICYFQSQSKHLLQLQGIFGEGVNQISHKPLLTLNFKYLYEPTNLTISESVSFDKLMELCIPTSYSIDPSILTFLSLCKSDPTLSLISFQHGNLSSLSESPTLHFRSSSSFSYTINIYEVLTHLQNFYTEYINLTTIEI
jgi:hypothetical protein